MRNTPNKPPTFGLISLMCHDESGPRAFRTPTLTSAPSAVRAGPTDHVPRAGTAGMSASRSSPSTKRHRLPFREGAARHPGGGADLGQPLHPRLRKVHRQIVAAAVPGQEAITRDNVTRRVAAV